MYKVSPLFSVRNKRFNVIILASGLGTRLKPETDFIPKALVELGQMRAIDYHILKYQYIAQNLIITVGYSADLLENYVKGKYSSLNLRFSRETVSELRGPGNSMVYALDHVDSRIPTLVTFCDYIVEDQFSVDYDGIAVCKPVEGYIYGTYKTLSIAEEGVAVDLVENHKIDEVRENGFTGIAIFHNTFLLKSLAYQAATSKLSVSSCDYAFDIVRPYIKTIRTMVIPLSRILEFGTEYELRQTREHVNGDNRLSR
jgi:NDP-sugar pyrophosphorylase family protein